MTDSIPQLSTVTLSLCGALCLYVTYRALSSRATIKAKERQYGCQPPKRLPVWDPIFGIDVFINTVRAIRNHCALSSFCEKLAKLGMRTTYFPMLGVGVVATFEPENAKAMLSTNFNDYGIDNMRDMLKPVLGDGIFTSDGATWQHSRALLRPAFLRTEISNLNYLEKHVEQLKLQLPQDGSTVDLEPLFSKLTLDIASEFLLGQSTNILSNADAEGMPEFAAAWEGAMVYIGGGSLSWRRFYDGKKNFKRDCKVISDFIDAIIDRASSEKVSLSDDEATRGSNVFLQSLLAQDEPKVRVRTELTNILFAGRETTAAFLTVLWFELARHPDVFRRLQQEIGETLTAQDGDLTFETLKSLPYLRAVLNETQRVHPIVPENARTALKDTVLPVGGGQDEQSPIFVRKGQFVAINLYGMHRRKDIFGEDANEYRPERWLDTEDGKGIRPGWAYLPFNGGPRVCIGQQFALSETSYVTVRLVQALDRLESRDSEPWREKLRIVLTVDNGCKVAMHFK